MNSVLHGDSRDLLKEIPDASIASVVCDPPYALVSISKRWGAADAAPPTATGAYLRATSGFMGKQWDTGETAFSPAFWSEVLRVLKPGGHLVAFGGTRTYHRLVCAIEDGGFEIRDQLAWLYGNGFPKSHNVKAGEFAGWGTALKPAQEPICLARKPMGSTVAESLAAHGTGALNIAASRIVAEGAVGLGRWPANVIHDGSPEVLAGFPDTGLSSGGSGSASQRTALAGHVYGEYSGSALGANAGGLGDSGSAARFFYTPKADKLDRLESKHPTVKPVDLMAYLIKLVTPKGGVVLDPFAGSGTTGMAAMREGFDCVLMEREAEYVADINRRLAHVHGDDLPLFGGST